jgi:RNA polymerase sigma-70 factor, ECF subfamily
VSREADDNYRRLRPLLFSIAYRMLGSVSDAEDVVQETLLRLHQAAAREEISSMEAYASTIATRLSLDTLKSARVQRERYVGSWLPEPLVDEHEPDVAEHAETADTLSLAFLVLLETLSPLERATFLLRQVFEFPYAEIATVLGRSEESCRQLATRARAHVADRRPRFEASRRRRDEMASRFLSACQDGDLDVLVDLLAEDVVFTGDGGGNVPPGMAVLRPVLGRDRVCRLLLGISRRNLDAHVEPAQVNGQPGALFRDTHGRLVSVLSLDIADGHVHAVRSVVNPAKLRHLGPLADLDALLGRSRAPSGTERATRRTT